MIESRAAFTYACMRDAPAEFPETLALAGLFSGPSGRNTITEGWGRRLLCLLWGGEPSRPQHEASVTDRKH